MWLLHVALIGPYSYRYSWSLVVLCIINIYVHTYGPTTGIYMDTETLRNFLKNKWRAAAIILAVVVAYYLHDDFHHRFWCKCCRLDGARVKIKGSSKKLLPIMNPLFNIREICKQTVLLEDHLFNPRKRCGDCIRKHFLTIEGLAEEAITLDKYNQYTGITHGLPEQIRSFQHRVLAGEDKHTVATDMRLMRKRLLPKCYNVVHETIAE